MNYLSVVYILVALGTAYANLDLAAREQLTYDLIAQIKSYRASVHALCANETGGQESFDDLFNKDIMPTTDKGKCLLECILKKFKLHKPEGGYDREGTRAYLSTALAAQMLKNPDILDRAMAVTEECNKIDVTGLNSCEQATKKYECSVIKMKENNINYKE